MAFGIYKPGQGYWVRVMTAVMLGVLTLAGAAWLFGEGQKLAGSLPQSRWTVSLSTAPEQPPAPGTPVTIEQRGSTGEFQAIANGELARSTGAVVNLKSVDLAREDIDYTRATHLSVQQNGGTARLPISGKPVRSAAIEPFYIQGSMALVAIAIGAFATIWLVGAKPQPVEFLIATDMEMKKVNWSTKRDILRSTNVVIFVSLVMSVALFGIDLVFQAFFKAIGILVN
jgi:preprotein translocase SecE subunit